MAPATALIKYRRPTGNNAIGIASNVANPNIGQTIMVKLYYVQPDIVA